MENVHKTTNRSWISDRVNLRQFRDEWWSVIPFSEKNIEPSNDYSFKNSVTKEEFLAVERLCSLEAIECQHKIDVDINKFAIPGGVNLQTLKYQEEELLKRAESHHYESLFYNSLKFHTYPSNKVIGASAVPDDIPYKPVVSPEIVLTVQIYRPEKKNNGYQKTSLFRAPIFQIDQEFLVLGSQYLSELRDKIECVSDLAVPGEFSDSPDLDPDIICKDLYKSGFFYIDGVFYNDMRNPDCRDYSDIIIKWAENKDRGIGPFQKAPMEKCQFINLTVQLGYPYVYVHQGNCEHLIVFSDVRMFCPQDTKNEHAYPLHASFFPKKPEFCMVCHIYGAVWVVFDNNRLPENPFFFCKQCFYGFNYQKNGKKIGDFRAYHFIDRIAMI